MLGLGSFAELSLAMLPATKSVSAEQDSFSRSLCSGLADAQIRRQRIFVRKSSDQDMGLGDPALEKYAEKLEKQLDASFNV